MSAAVPCVVYDICKFAAHYRKGLSEHNRLRIHWWMYVHAYEYMRVSMSICVYLLKTIQFICAGDNWSMQKVPQ